MRCKVCGSETDKLKHGLCRPCFMVAGVESEEMKEALENDLPKKYHIPVNKEVSTKQVFMQMAEDYQKRVLSGK